MVLVFILKKVNDCKAGWGGLDVLDCHSGKRDVSSQWPRNALLDSVFAASLSLYFQLLMVSILVHAVHYFLPNGD